MHRFAQRSTKIEEKLPQQQLRRLPADASLSSSASSPLSSSSSIKKQQQHDSSCCQCWRSTSKRSKALFSVLLLGITVQVHLASTTLSLASIDLMEGAMVLDAKSNSACANVTAAPGADSDKEQDIPVSARQHLNLLEHRMPVKYSLDQWAGNRYRSARSRSRLVHHRS